MPSLSSHPGTRDLLALAWPVVVSRSCQVVIGLCDAAMVGPLGEEALAAATTGSLNAYSIFILPIGVVSIVSSFASQLFGAGDLAGARRYAWYGLLLAAAVEAIGVVAGSLVGSALSLFDFAPGLREQMTGYLAIRLLSAGAVIGLEGLANYYGGLGNTRLPMLANFAAMALNVPLNWILIYGHLGFPAMGVRGAATASVAATGIAFGGLFALFLAGIGAPGGRVGTPLVPRELLRMLRFGLPNGVNWFLEFAAFTFFVNVVVASLGTTALAALMSVIQVNGVSFMPAFGLASAGAILVGQAIGARRAEDVPGIVRRTFAVAAAWQGLVGLFYVAMPGAILSIFLRGHPDAGAFVTIGAPMLAVSAAWQLFDAAGITLTEALRAAGDTAFCLWARLVLAWLGFVPLSLLWARRLGGGPVAAMVCIVIYLAALAGALAWRFRQGEWRKIDLTGRERFA